MNPINKTLACPSFEIIGPEKANKGIPVTPPTVIVIPIKDLEAPKSSRSQKRKDSI